MKVADDILRAVDAGRVALTTLLSELVAIPTENPPATGYAHCLARLEAYPLTALSMVGAG